MASYFRLGEDELDPSLPWRSQKVQRNGRNGSSWDEYQITCDLPGQKDWIFKRVTSVLGDSLPFGDALVKWKIKQTLLDAFARFFYVNSDRIPGPDEHLQVFDEFQKVTQSIAIEGARKLPSGRIALDKKWSFQRLSARAGNLLFGYPDNLSREMLADWFDAAAEQSEYRATIRAAELGTRAHQLIEIWLKQGCTFEFIQDGEELTFNLENEEPEVQNAVAAFFDWWDKHEFSVYRLEERVFDIKLGIAGTLDGLFCDRKGRHVLMDWKTSGAIYDKHYVQAAAYGLCCKRMGEAYGLGYPAEAYIIRFDKQTAQFEPYCVWDNEIQFHKHADQWVRCVMTDHYLREISGELKRLRGEP